MPHLTFPFLVFCVSVVLIYWMIPENYRKWLLAATGTAFLCYIDLFSFALLLALTITIFLYSHNPVSYSLQKITLAGLLAVFCLVRFAQLLYRLDQVSHLLVLFGFGFYILKLIHYTIEHRRGRFREHSFIDFYNYALFFPTITVGPIHRFEDFLRSARRIRWDDAVFAGGLERILYGYVKVTVLANYLISLKIASMVSLLKADHASLAGLLESVVYGFHLYFAFAGFSDIAIGLSMLFGYQMCENFNWPFVKRNIGEFWQSWHMSLSFWCRQYVFLPYFAHSRNLPLALLLTMITIGLWHEFSARYFLWGVYHGTGILVWRWYQERVGPALPSPQRKVWKHLTASLSIALTFSFVMVGFTIPRSSSVTEIITNFQTIIGR